MADGTPAKKPAKKTAAKKTPAARKKAAAARKRQTVEQRKQVEDQTRALNWAVAHSSPLAMLDGWDPETGVWDPESRVGQMIARIARGAHINTAAKVVHLGRMTDVVQKGRSYLADASLSEDRTLIPIELRPFVDLAVAVDHAEALTELTASEKIYDAIDDDPRLGLTWLSRRFPERWSEQQQILAHVEYDPRSRAVAEMLDDPNVALQLAGFARQAEERAAGYDEQDV